MSHTRLASMLVFAMTIVAAGRAAAPGSFSPAAGVAAPASPPKPVVTTVPSRAAVSPETAARLAATAPKYEAAAAPKPAEPGPDLRETDKPRNTIIRLPNYVVQEKKPPTFKERELFTPRARVEVALKRFPGLRVGNFFGLNAGLASAMLAEEERLEAMREMEDLASLMRFSDPAAHAAAKREVERTFMRDPGFGR